jgi:hypothetical protein
MQSNDFDTHKTIQAFLYYMQHGNKSITKPIFEKNLDDKTKDADFTNDILRLLSTTTNNHTAKHNQQFDALIAAEDLKNKMLILLPDNA